MFRHTNSISTPPRHKRSKASAAAVLALICVFCCSTFAAGHDDKVVDSQVLEVIDEIQKRRADLEAKKSQVCRMLDGRIADLLADRFDRKTYVMTDFLSDMIEAWEDYCKDREFDRALILKSLKSLADNKENAD